MRSDTINSRFHRLGFSVKAITASIVAFCVWLYLPLGVLAFGCFLYLHLLLRYVARTPADTTSILSPIDGRVVTIENDGDSTQLTLMSDWLGSQMIYAPMTGVVHDKLWMDGLYLPPNVATEASDAARFEVYMRDNDDRAIIMKLYGTHFTRLLHVPFEEGQSVMRGEPFGFALLRAQITIHLPQDFKIKVSEGEYCLAGQTAIAAD